MTILSKEALEKIRKETAARREESPDDIEALFRELDGKLQEKKESEEEKYNPFVEDDFDTFTPGKE
ncbi:hypothetical protein [Legionella brunensis]|uniref:Uncharacterized protein n=1 Tax=Legionella brunensis TaxID=29422 RepID=A0A0W0SNL3_9GAMM|nr:hypothetical protein [Legionella brunensis]KTC84894.1 hypothetical protein Lbru_1109 [Legionella brunensis]